MFIMPPVFRVGDVIRFGFDTYDASRNSVTITGLAVTDIEIYKRGSVTQRASDNGYALLDVDGIDFDGNVGFHGFEIDTSDNSDAGFWENEADYLVHINAIDVDGATIRFTYYLVLGYLPLNFPLLSVNGSGYVGSNLRMVINNLLQESTNGNLATNLSDYWDDSDQTGAGVALSDLLALNTILNNQFAIANVIGTPTNLGSGTSLAFNLSDMAGAAFVSASHSLVAIEAAAGGGAGTVIYTPILTSLGPGEVQFSKAFVYRNAAGSLLFVVTDAQGDPVVLTSTDLDFYVAEKENDTNLVTLQSPGDIAVGGVDSNEVTVTWDEDTFDSITQSKVLFALRTRTTGEPWAWGEIELVNLPEATAP